MDNSTAKTLLFVLNYNGTKMTCDLLSSLAKVGLPYPTWVVDNGSEQDDSDEFRTALPTVVVKRIPENLGFAGGVNRAMEMAAAEGFDYAYEMNNDTLATDDFLTPCVDIMKFRSDVDVIGSRTLTLDPGTGEFSIWGFRSAPKWLPKFKDGFFSTNRVVGCGMLLRVSTFRSFGGLDERFFLYMEETDYCFRLLEAGRKVGIAAGSIILHQGKATNDGSTVRYFYARNVVLFSRLHDPLWLNSGSILAKEVVLKNLRDLAKGNLLLPAAAGHGFADALRGRFGKRVRPIRIWSGILLFLFLSPPMSFYAAIIHLKKVRNAARRGKDKTIVSP